MLVSITYLFTYITLNIKFCQWRLSNWKIIFKSIVQRAIFLFTDAHNNQQKTEQNVNGCKERDCVMNYMYYCINSKKSSLSLPFSFLFPFPFFPFLANAFFFSLSFCPSSLLPLSFHFVECTSGLRSINGHNSREGYNYLKATSHSLLCSVWKMHVFFIHTSDQLRQNSLVLDSSEGIHSRLCQPKKNHFYLLFTPSDPGVTGSSEVCGQLFI